MTLKRSRRGAVPPFIVMDVMRAANAREAEGHDVVHLEVGQPATGAPAGVLDAVRNIVGADPLGYTEATGIPALRGRIAEHYAAAYGCAVDPDRVFVTTGSSGGFVLSFLPRSTPATGWRSPSPAIPPTATFWRRWGSRRCAWPPGRTPGSSRAPRCSMRSTGPSMG